MKQKNVHYCMYEKCSFKTGFKNNIFTDVARTNKEGVLMRELLTGYERDIKPTMDATSPIFVTFDFYLHRIEGLVSKKHLLFWEQFLIRKV